MSDCFGSKMYSIGSSIVTICSARSVLIESTSAASVVVFPCPTGPTTRKNPCDLRANESRTSGRLSSATVRILIICPDSLIVFNAISPNGDGRNDVLVIQGLQNYPNHLLLIYNRWGNEVYKTKDYQQDWGGTWNGKILPDGTYFYLLRDETSNKILAKGYLQILR